MRNQSTPRKDYVPAERTLMAFFAYLKGRQATIHGLWAYEDTLKDFFQGEGTDFINDITEGSLIKCADAIDASHIASYKARLIDAKIPADSINKNLLRLQQFLDYCAKRGFIHRVEVELVRMEE